MHIALVTKSEKQPVAFINAFTEKDTFEKKAPQVIIKHNTAIFRKPSLAQRVKAKTNFYSGKSQQKLPADEILKLLHTQIAAHQIYPADAVELNQNGRVRVRFIMQRNGELKNILLEQSSGYTSIDAAALAAVKAASPIPAASRYLQASTAFSIDIVFA